MTFSFKRRKYQKMQSVRGTWHAIKGTEPKVHLLAYNTQHHMYLKLCEQGSIIGIHGTIVDDSTEVTCKRCLMAGAEAIKPRAKRGA